MKIDKNILFKLLPLIALGVPQFAAAASSSVRVDSLDPINRSYLESFCSYHPGSGLCFFTPNPPVRHIYTPPDGDGGGSGPIGDGPAPVPVAVPPVDCRIPSPPVFTASSCSMKSNLFLNPFTADSAQHRPIGCGAIYADSNHPATRNWLSAGNGIGFNVGAPFGVSVFAVSDADAPKTVNAKAGCPSNNLPASIPFPAGGIITRTNDERCGDGMVAIINQSRGQGDQLRGYNWNDGAPTAQNHYAWDIRGLGHGRPGGGRVGSSASGVAAIFGILRGAEINTAGVPIQHALQISLPWGKSGPCPAMLAPRFMSPAVSMDGNAGRYGVGQIPYGALLALPPASRGGPNLDSLGLSEPGKRLARALQEYGAYAVDSTNCPNIRTDQYVANTDALKADMRRIYPYMRMVLNSTWVPGQPSVGGGTPLAPNCAFDAR
ncbi:MAG: hypothetical protein U1E36_00485 [Rickettsiales bacterium]